MCLRSEHQRLGSHRASRHAAATGPTDAVGRHRKVAVVVAMFCLIVTAAVIPAQSTLASFTDAESATSAPLTAASLPIVNNLTCTARWALLAAPWVELNWTDMTAGTLPATEYEVTVTSAQAIVATKRALGTTAQFKLSDLKMTNSGSYTITVKAKSSSAVGWTSVGGDGATFTTVWLLDGLNTCS